MGDFAIAEQSGIPILGRSSSYVFNLKSLFRKLSFKYYLDSSLGFLAIWRIYIVDRYWSWVFLENYLLFYLFWSNIFELFPKVLVGIASLPIAVVVVLFFTMFFKNAKFVSVGAYLLITNEFCFFFILLLSIGSLWLIFSVSFEELPLFDKDILSFKEAIEAKDAELFFLVMLGYLGCILEVIIDLRLFVNKSFNIFVLVERLRFDLIWEVVGLTIFMTFSWRLINPNRSSA